MLTLEEETLTTLKEDLDNGKIIRSDDSEHISTILKIFGKSFPYDTAQETISTDYFDESVSYLLQNITFLMSSDYAKIIMISDSDLSFALTFTYESLSKHAETVLSLPQHKYFFAEDYSWCIFFKMEGYMGVAKPLPNQ
ncbi:MAG: hypothetical protein H7145_01640 [Akkermansiaceae bacterium]|nr:hypothetical protein [Armatimonadota bacterium]